MKINNLPDTGSLESEGDNETEKRSGCLAAATRLVKASDEKARTAKREKPTRRDVFIVIGPS
ncbi:MAG TPA: hypothetical protein VI306_17650 [Pyrinomonadaceae bacterium]